MRVWLHRLFVKYNFEKAGYRKCIVRNSRVVSSQTGKENRKSSSRRKRLGGVMDILSKHGYVEYQERHMMKKL